MAYPSTPYSYKDPIHAQAFHILLTSSVSPAPCQLELWQQGGDPPMSFVLNSYTPHTDSPVPARSAHFARGPSTGNFRVWT